MKLLAKFNLVLFILFALGTAATTVVLRDLLQRNAREEIRENAKLLIESALAVRTYTSKNIAPLLETQIKYEFRPEMVSAYSAIEMLKHLREANPDYKNFQYREATLNPTNPVNRAVEWESDIVNSFRNGTADAPLFGERDTPNGRMLYVAKPLRAGGATTGQVFAVRNNEIFLMSQPRPVRSVHRAEGWTPQSVAQHALPALQASFYPLDRSADVFSWDPI